MKSNQSINIYKSYLNSKSVQVFLGFMIMFISSQLFIDIKPVPITMHPVGALLIGLLYSPTVAFFGVLSWILAGALGIPVFHGYSSALNTPSMGYVVGMLVAAHTVSMTREKVLQDSSMFSLTILCVMGSCIVYFFGMCWLAYLFDFQRAVTFGLLPFIIPGLIKVVILSSILNFIKGKA